MSIYQLISRIPGLAKPSYNYLYKWVAKRQRKSNKSLLLKLEEVKNVHNGNSCFIVGTGPSLNTKDLHTLQEKNIVTFAPNRIFELTEKIDWQPTYYICQDHHIIRSFKDRIAEIPSKSSFVPVEYVETFKDPKFKFFVLRERDYYPGLPKFSKDITKRIDQGYTVTYGAIQLASYMGFKNIYLLGVDHNYSVYRDSKGRPVRQNYQKRDYPEEMTNYMNEKTFPRIEESTIAYEKAEKVSGKLGFKVFNATRGGKLEAFERVDFDKLMEEWKTN